MVNPCWEKVHEASPPEARLEAMRIAFDSFISQNRLPAGMVIAQKPTAYFGDLKWDEWRKYTDGERYNDDVVATASGISMWAGIGALVLTIMPIPGTRILAAALLLSAGAAGIVASSVSIADRVDHDTFEWNEQTAFDIATLVTGLAMGIGGTVQGFKIALNSVGKGVMIAIGAGLDTGWGILLTSHYGDRIKAIQADKTMSTIQQESEITDILKRPPSSVG
ncbi:MAG: hypothetical protein IPP17_30340 [Bacteroidetes bacterium]|nr:hypothetical protein [Bacteroidota bacterium]